jgi:hypothetical protein
MARQKRIVERKPIISRTVERIAIASLAAIATRGSSESIALVAITIFVILVSIEELGRSWIWDGKRTDLRAMAWGSIGSLRLRRADNIERRKRERRRAWVRGGARGKAVGPAHKPRRKVLQ